MSEILFNVMTLSWNKKRTCGTPETLNVTSSYETARGALLEAYGKGFKDVYLKAEFEACNHIWFICVDCKADKTKDGDGVAFYVQPKNGGASGYAVTKENERVCFDCSAKREREFIEANEKWTAYLVKREDSYFVTDWTGKVCFPVLPYSMARTKYPLNKPHKRAIEPYHVTTASFKDHKGRVWTGKNDSRRGDLFDAKLKAR